MKNIFEILVSVLVLMSCSLTMDAQGIKVPKGYELKDSIVYRPADVLEPRLKGKNIFDVMPVEGEKGAKASVQIFQSQSILEAFKQKINSNKQRIINGYRVRIFFDNKQNSRAESKRALEKFQKSYPGVASYRSYENPFFKVMVGDFRFKSEAMSLLKDLKKDFPAAFVVKSNINYPSIDNEKLYIVDTLYVLRPIKKANVRK